MKKIFKRFLAYAIDMLIIITIITCVSNIQIINRQLKNYNKYYDEYQELYTNYQTFETDFEKYYKDKKITSDEYEELTKDNSSYQKELEKYYKDKKITSKEYNKIIENTTSNFQKEYKKLYYNLNKYSTVYNIICILVILLYFVGFNILTDGQTLGKKILKLQIVSNNNSKVSFINYLIRTIILYNPIYYLAMIIGPYMFNINNFYTWAIIWSNIKNYLQIIIIIMIIIRIDGRGLHDILANTKVISLVEEENNLVEELNNKEDTTLENNKEEQVEIIRPKKKIKKRKTNKKIIIDDQSNKEDE